MARSECENSRPLPSRRVGLTGGIGCGKSTVIQALRELGARTVETDQLTREALQRNERVIEQVKAAFGEEVFSEGSIDRGKLGGVVFSDPDKLKELEAIVHPVVHQKWQALCAEEPNALWVVEIPLLFEKRLEKHFHVTICVSSSRDVAISRLEKRGLPRHEAAQRMARQMPLAKKRRLADYVISNSGPLDLTHLQIRLFLASLS